MPDFYFNLTAFITMAAFFITLIGLQINTRSRVSRLETEMTNLDKHVIRLENNLEKIEKDLRDDLTRQRREREQDTVMLWKEVSDMKHTLTKAVTLIESNSAFIQETLKRHDSLFEKLEKRLH